MKKSQGINRTAVMKFSQWPEGLNQRVGRILEKIEY
jgi:hypothetical protein